jgi:small subunit ribosomal protein S14
MEDNFHMTASDWRKLYKQLKAKPAIAKKFLKHNKPKDRKFGVAAQKCEKCGRYGARVGQYGLNYCRQCFREIAEDIGFKKYS